MTQNKKKEIDDQFLSYYFNEYQSIYISKLLMI